MRLATTDTQLHGLESVAHGRLRKGTTSVQVDLQALRNILADHATLLAAATGPVCKPNKPYGGSGKGHRVELGDDQASMTGLDT